MVKLYQFRLSARGRKVFKEARVRRRVLLGLVELLAGMLVSFSLVFKHGHLEAYCEESETGTLRRSIRKRASAVVGVPFERVWCDPVESEPHLVTLLRYNADQVVHHDLPEHPALFDGSYVQDMVGARALPGLRLRVAGAAPGFRVRQLYEWVGLPGVPIRPATDVEVRAAGIGRLKVAAASATAADPELAGRRAPEVRAKRAIVHLARAAGIRPADVRWALGLTQRGVEAHRARPADPCALRATRVRLALEDAVTRATWTRVKGS